MTSITVLTEDSYHAEIEKAENDDTDGSVEHRQKTNITPEDIIGNVVTFESPETWHGRTMGEVTAIDMNGEHGPEATISELFINREHTETGHHITNDDHGGFINLSLPSLGSKHTVKWLEAKIDGEWETVSDVVLEAAMTEFTRLKHEYDITRMMSKTYTHNPQGLCTLPIRPNDDGTRGEVIPDTDQFTDPELYNRLMDNVIIPETAGAHTQLGTLYTQSDRRQHDEKRAHKIIDIQVDIVAQPERAQTARKRIFSTDISLAEKIKYVLGPDPREDVFGVDPTADDSHEQDHEEAA